MQSAQLSATRWWFYTGRFLVEYQSPKLKIQIFVVLGSTRPEIELLYFAVGIKTPLTNP